MPILTEEDIKIREKYLKAPTREEMLSFLKEVGVSKAQFEIFYDMPARTLVRAINGHVTLSVKFWPIFYERKIPAYGKKWVKSKKKMVKSKKKFVSKNVSKKTQGDVKRLTDL